MAFKKQLRTCPEGHQYFKSSSCPVCPVCEKEKIPANDILSALSSPARRALENAGITDIHQLAAKSVDEILRLHGIGPSSIPKLQKVLEKHGLSFAKP